MENFNTDENTSFDGSDKELNSESLTMPSPPKLTDGEYKAPAPSPLPEESGEAVVKKGWKGAVLAVILAISAFAGAFFGVFYICRTSIYRDSKFFDAFIAKWSGVTENRIEVDYISGEYTGDGVTLADKALSHTVLVRCGHLRGESKTFVQTDSGSGVIYARIDNTDSYYIVTNYHVIANAQAVVVELYSEDESSDDNRITAQIKYTDEISDIAVLKIECDKELSPAVQADSSKAKRGQGIILAGNPLGHGFSVSLGYVSNPCRVTTANNNVPLMTLDASVNFGNSGGGVFDSAGNLLGLVVSKASGEDIDGIGYAIPVNTVNKVVNDLLTYGYVKGRAAIGITVYGIYNAATYSSVATGELSGFIFESNAPHYGVYIGESENSLLKKGDRIVEIDGKAITVSADITAVLLGKKPGGNVSITVERQSLPDPDGEIVYTQETVNILLIERNFAD